MTDCPCGSGRALDACCGPYLDGAVQAPTAEALMRSRYSAFSVGKIDYLKETLLPETQDDFNRDEVAEWAASSQWKGLEVRSVEGGGEGDDEGKVEFIARFKMAGKDYTHHEVGRFGKRDGRWYYVDGEIGARPQAPRTVTKIGRNDPCTCGSGKKYKKCCGAAAA
ncbi:MAG TPA: YchJ family protein [Azospirillaceae bacterium]|nr:YchJ family protein [Azospirillaceae bacterium]